tara:strand:+ start:407 stop:835 length:429 start_codon:yes stop_codon:yes gene_type:complete
MFKGAVIMLGLSALAIGGMIYLAGPDVTGNAFASILRIAAPDTPQLNGLKGADVDSELRFYAVLWCAFGAMALWGVRNLPERMHILRLMLLVFWIGGVGRMVSYFAVGAPHPLFIVLMWIEIALPPLLIALSFRKAASGSAS